MSEEVKDEKGDKFVSAVGDVVGMQRLPNGGCQVVVNINPYPYPDRPKDAEKLPGWERECAELDAMNFTMIRGLRFDRVDLVQKALQYESV